MILLLTVLFWGGMLVLRFIVPMLGTEGPTRSLKPRVLIPLGLVTVAGFLFDQYIHGRFL